jgi:tetratricopeptide (TPR) repeat protein
MPARAVCIGVALLSLWALRSYDQAGVWLDERSVWAHAVTVSPVKPRVLINVGRSLELDQRPADAVFAYQAALESSWDARRPWRDSREARAVARTNLGRLAFNAGRRGDGFAYFDAAVDEWGEFAPARFQRGIAYARVGRCDESRRDFEAVLALTGKDVRVACEPR